MAPPRPKDEEAIGRRGGDAGRRARILRGRGSDFQNIGFCGSLLTPASPAHLVLSKRCGRGTQNKRETPAGDSALFNINKGEF